MLPAAAHLGRGAGGSPQQRPVDHLGGTRGRVLGRERRGRAADRPFRADDLHVAVEALVLGDARIDAEGQRADDGGLRRAVERGVERADHLRRTLGEVDDPPVVFDGELGAHRHVLGAVAVAVHPVFAVVGAGPHLADIGADAARGVVEQLGGVAAHGLRPVALDQGRELLLAAPGAGHVRHQVAVAVGARAQVAEVELQHVPAQLAALENRCLA